jgi:GxxExxY protein
MPEVTSSFRTTKSTKSTKMKTAERESRSSRTESAATAVVDSAIKVHSALGPGLLESVYESCLCHELSKRKMPFQRQVELPIEYDGVRLETGLRIDVLVDGCVIVELKAVESLLPLHQAQLLTYLKLTRSGFKTCSDVPIVILNAVKNLLCQHRRFFAPLRMT